MDHNIIPNLISLETKLTKIRGFFFSDFNHFYEATGRKNIFHYKVLIDNNIVIPDDYDFRNGHYYKKGDVWYYKRKVGFFTLKFLYDQKNKIFSYNKIYSLIPFEIGHIFPPGRHLSDLIIFDLFLKGLIFIRGCAVKYSDKNLAFIAPSYNGKTGLVKQVIERGGKYISEEFFVLDLGSKFIFPSHCSYTNERLTNQQLQSKLNKKNIITKKIRIDKFILYLNQGTGKHLREKGDFFDFAILRSLFFFKNDLIKSYIFSNNLTSHVFQIINNLQKIRVNFRTKQITDYQFDDLFKE